MKEKKYVAEKIENFQAEIPVEEYMKAVSYTHLDVYKRQEITSAGCSFFQVLFLWLFKKIKGFQGELEY